MQWPLFGSLYISVFVYQHLDFSFGCKSSCKMVSIWYVSWLLHLAFCLTFSNIFNQMIHTIFVCCASILMFHHMVNLESLKFIIRLACVCVCASFISTRLADYCTEFKCNAVVAWKIMQFFIRIILRREIHGNLLLRSKYLSCSHAAHLCTCVNVMNSKFYRFCESTLRFLPFKCNAHIFAGDKNDFPHKKKEL